MFKTSKIVFMICVLMMISIFSPISSITSAKSTSTTSSDWEIGIAYSNRTILTNGSTIAFHSYLIAFSNQSVEMAFIFVNNSQVESLGSWHEETSSAVAALNYKLLQGSGNRTITPYALISPFSLAIPANQSSTVGMTAYQSDCSSTSVSYTVNANSTQDGNYSSSSITNTTNSADYCTTTSNASNGFEYFMIVPSLLVFIVLKRKSSRKQ